MRLPSPATWSKSIPWTSVPCLAWSSNSSPPAMWFPAGMCCKRTPAPPLKPLPSSSTLCSTVCRFPSAPCRSMAAREFAAEFEQACQQRGLHLFVLPPRSPKLNGAVERANRTHTEEFYQVTPCSLEMKKLNRHLRHWEKIYNTVRPHQALGGLNRSSSFTGDGMAPIRILFPSWQEVSLRGESRNVSVSRQRAYFVRQHSPGRSLCAQPRLVSHPCSDEPDPDQRYRRSNSVG